ncbi:unnamed protein product [Triticum turgidum subsp. durum]|uniref:Cytochrome c oxidase assembly factor 3 mitochondrial coiled-coil domain-containing protein n=1 Tax=Triticum turgidum subsp. durum TaxID=4567 RepID=A0A9R0PZW1_TRITD|nr:unnamed protein product [Triticum turgidum subsp. durum]
MPSLKVYRLYFEVVPTCSNILSHPCPALNLIPAWNQSLVSRVARGPFFMFRTLDCNLVVVVVDGRVWQPGTQDEERGGGGRADGVRLRGVLLHHVGGFGSLAPKTKNVVVAGGLTGFVFGVYYYTMWAVGSTDELQVTIDKFEDLKKKEAAASTAASASTPGSS